MSDPREKHRLRMEGLRWGRLIREVTKREDDELRESLEEMMAEPRTCTCFLCGGDES